MLIQRDFPFIADQHCFKQSYLTMDKADGKFSLPINRRIQKKYDNDDCYVSKKNDSIKNEYKNTHLFFFKTRVIVILVMMLRSSF